MERLLYYAQEVDCTMLASLRSIATQQSAPMKKTMKKINQLLDYAATHTDAAITRLIGKTTKVTSTPPYLGMRNKPLSASSTSDRKNPNINRNPMCPPKYGAK